MKKTLISAFALCSILSGVSVFLGLMAAVNAKSGVSVAFCFVITIVVMALLLCSKEIWKSGDILYLCAKLLWFVSYVVAMGSVCISLCNHIILQRDKSDINELTLANITAAAPPQMVAVGFFWLILVTSPLAVSWTWHRFHDDDLDEDDDADGSEDKKHVEPERKQASDGKESPSKTPASGAVPPKIPTS